MNKKYFIGFIIVFLIEAFIAVFVRDQFIRPFVGDVLVIILMYLFIKSFIKRPMPLLPIYLWVFAILVEIGQYFNLVEILGLQNSRLCRVIMGTTFDIKDIVCYTVGALILVGWQLYRKNMQRKICNH